VDQAVEFDVSARDRTVRVDIAAVSAMTSTDVDAIVATVAELLADPEVRAIRLGGRAFLQGVPPEGIVNVIRALDSLARQHGKELIVGPI
jgi:hypothetical protein